MNLTDKISKKVQALPAEKQAEILDFVDFLEKKLTREEEQEWSEFSLASAMHGLEADRFETGKNAPGTGAAKATREL